MTAEERRVIEALQAYTGGLIVTDQDVNNAKLDLQESLEQLPSTPKPWRPIALGAAAVVALIAGFVVFQTAGGDNNPAEPAGPPGESIDPFADYLTGSAPTADQLEGVWRQDAGNAQLRFGSDGSFALTENGRLYTDPIMTGEYTFSGDLITVTLDGAECGGQQFAMRASLPDADANPGWMLSAVTEVGSAACAPDVAGARWGLQHALPTNEDEMRTLGPAEDEDWRPATVALVKHGDWMAVGGGHLLELAPGGVYVVAAGSGEVVDRGRYAITPERELHLVSGSDSPTCDKGDRLVIGQAGYFVGDADFIRGTTEQNTCGGAWTPEAWFLLPHEGTE